ncbi:hypothetical protein E2C01_055844 [Portunus trituberculatus]|uniref:Uncharacterized protein n=1 Tax=Portunus trituberculatus TaxID=210409 RepID=A0A5B7GX75_PORTR|nr:hypothetical protein [Portunus trituberculatus]
MPVKRNTRLHAFFQLELQLKQANRREHVWRGGGQSGVGSRAGQVGAGQPGAERRAGRRVGDVLAPSPPHPLYSNEDRQLEIFIGTSCVEVTRTTHVPPSRGGQVTR